SALRSASTSASSCAFVGSGICYLSFAKDRTPARVEGQVRKGKERGSGNRPRCRCRHGVRCHQMIAAPFHVLLVVAAVFLLTGGSGLAQAPSDDVRFATDIEKARGHLVVSNELYAAGHARPAAVHAAHPVQELGNRLVAPLRRVDDAAAKR